MLISLKWLNEYIDIKDKEIPELENALTMIGQEVEKIETKFSYLKTVVTAKIVEYSKVEDSDHLTLCKVDTGSEILQIICGAPNHKLGDVVCLAKIGTQLAPDFIIKKSKIRGILSQGMLCSKKELGLGNEADGIIILPQDTKLGVALSDYYDKGDTVFELEITPNRPDCLSYIGIARELSAYYNQPLKKPEIKIEEKGENIDFSVKIQDEKLSNRYLARVIKNIKVEESPKWLKDRLEAIGVKSVNNIVDISNYVMFEMGQPNHIYDLDKLGKEVEVRRAFADEEFVTLDDKKIKLTTEDIVVASNGKAVALAGVIGGLDTCVDENTKNILIETAHFDNIMVRRSSRRHAIFTEASYRFERWVDTISLDKVSKRLAQFIGGDLQKGFVEEYKFKPILPDTLLNLEKLYKFIGKRVEKNKVLDIFKKLEIKVEDNGSDLLLTPPCFRSDLLTAQDYYEEVIRMYGFDNIENILPDLEIKKDLIIDNTKLNCTVKLILANLGLKEVINYSFIPKTAFAKIKSKEEDLIEISNPITEDFAIMRPTFMYSLLKNASDNFNRSVQNVNFFEVAKTFLKDKEITKIGIVLSGTLSKDIFNNERQYDFYDMKGIVEELFAKLNIKSYSLYRTTNEAYHLGRAADIYVGNTLLGTFGQIHPDLEENFDLENKSTIYCELNLDEMSKYMKSNFKYKSLSKYQLVTRDLAFVVKEDVQIGEILKAIEKSSKIVNKIELFDIYKGGIIEKGYKSFAIKLYISDPQKTLEEKEINEVVNKVIDKITKDYSASIRN